MNRPALLHKIRDAAQRYGAKTELAHELGYSRVTIREKLKRDDGFTDDELKRAAAALAVAGAEDLLERYERGEVDRDGQATRGGGARAPAAGVSLDDFLFLPRYEIRAAAGGGQAVHSEQVVDFLAFRRDWVRGELGLDPRELLLIEAHGDSMEPTLSSGDLLLIHTAEPRVRDNAIYAIGVDGDVVVKRVQRRIDGTLVIRSDNPTYEPEELAPERADTLRVIGRVVWVGRKI